MRIGIISEGQADIAVLTNLLKGLTGLDSNDIVPLRPKLKFDKTHLAHLDPESHGTWSLVRQECIERKKIEDFLAVADNTHIVIHIDTAEATQFDVRPPIKNNHIYCEKLRALVINKIHQWLDFTHLEETIYAIAIEEIDAWLLPIFETKDSCLINNPKSRLQYILTKKGQDSTSNYANYLKLSIPLSKDREIVRGKLLSKNCSLRLFYEEVKFSVMNRNL